MSESEQSNIDNELFKRQLKLEEEMVSSGVNAFYERIRKAEEKGHQAETVAGLRLRKEALEPMIKALQKWIDDRAGGQVGRHGTAYKKLVNTPVKKTVFIGMTVILNSLTKDDCTLQSVAINIGKAIEDEMRFCKFQKEANPYFQKVYDRVKAKGNYNYKAKVLIHAMNNGAKIGWEEWTPTEKLHIGKLLIELMVTETGIIEIAKKTAGRGRFSYYVTVPAKTLEWISKLNSQCENLTPECLPMVVPPKPWRSPYEGGYYSDFIINKRLVKRVSREYCQELANSDISTVLKAVNAVQETPWKVNQKVLDVVNQIWEMNSQLGGLPDQEMFPLPPSPLTPEMKTDNLPEHIKPVFDAWCLQKAETIERNRSRASKVMQASMVLKLARRFHDDTVYFPHSIDWRGRMYPMPTFLNPQGDDLARGLLTFWVGKALDNERAAQWLAIHGANTYGFDKVSLEERVKFIHDKTPEIIAVATDPLANKQWNDAASPFQYLAFCFEWAGYIREGLSFTSTLPIQLDGTCNGLQHFSAMLRDKAGGEAVNLVPGPVPEDIYERVAQRSRDKLTAVIKAGDENAFLAMEWMLLKDGITRDLTKKSVMVLPYGGTKVGNRKAVESYIKKYMEKYQLKEPPFKEGIFKASHFMGEIIWESITEVVVSARLAMDWLRNVAQVVSSEDIPLTWTSPSGLPIQQRKVETRRKRIDTKLLGSIVQLSILEDTQKIDKIAQQNGISPNFIHSMDAAAVHLTVSAMADNNIINYSMIHDSYGSLAADTELVAQLTRDVFVTIYQVDVLEQFRDQIIKILPAKKAEKIPPLPAKGDLDIELVRQSKFFFA